MDPDQLPCHRPSIADWLYIAVLRNMLSAAPCFHIKFKSFSFIWTRVHHWTPGLQASLGDLFVIVPFLAQARSCRLANLIVT
eukprot:g25681.t1